MKLIIKSAFAFLALLSFTLKCSCQDSSSLYNTILGFPDRFFKKVDHKTQDIYGRLTTQTDKYISSLAREEMKLKKRLAKKDSTAASRIFDDAQLQYAALRDKIDKVSDTKSSLKNKYIPHLDSLHTVLEFLANAGIDLNTFNLAGMGIGDVTGNLELLQNKFDQAEDVKNFIQQRRKILLERLNKYGLSKTLRKYQQQVYYYQAQVNEYKKTFDDPSRVEARVIDILRGTALFRDFFKKNSQLAGLFRLPAGTSGTSVSMVANLQTRETIQRDLLQRFGSSSDVQQVMQQQITGAKEQLKLLKDKISSLGEGNSELALPDFKPNNQKTKSFKDRLEVGGNLQTAKGNMFFPSTTDLGLSVGYRLNDKSIIGIGSSYKMGWGKDIKHIEITHQGVGLRSFIDYKIKGSFWLSGGAELNYRSQFHSFEILNDYSAWQRSALLGISKKYAVNKKLKGNAQVLYDFLYKEEVPRTQRVLFRIGYSLK